MLLSSLCAAVSALFALSIRKNKKLLSAVIAVESFIFIAMLAVTVLSAVGGGTSSNVYVLIMARAICGEFSFIGVSVSTLMLIQAAVILFVCCISLYFIYRVVKKALKSNGPVKVFGGSAQETPFYYFRGFTKRKVFLLNCRLNN